MWFAVAVEEVKKTVPAEKLLVFNVKEGYGPLCKFLELPEPAEPFPRVNEKARFEMLIRIFGRVDKIGKFVVFPSLAAGLAWGVSKLLRRVM